MPNYWPGYSPPAPTGGGIGGGNEANFYGGGYTQSNPGFPSGTQPWVHPALRNNQGFPPATEPWVHPALRNNNYQQTNQGFPPATEPWVHPALRNQPGGMGGGGMGGNTTGAEKQPTLNASLLSGNMNDYNRWERPTHNRMGGGGFAPNVPSWVRGF